MSSAIELCSSTTLNTRYSFPVLRAAKYLRARLSFSLHRTAAFCRSSHTSHVSSQVAVLPPRTSLLSRFAALSDNEVPSTVLIVEPGPPSHGETSSCALCTQRATSAALALQIYSKIAKILATDAFHHYWLMLSLCNGPPSFLSHPVADHHLYFSHSHK